jgi:hypothetical protein
MRQRDYKAEYARRRANAQRLGRSVPQARGHPRHGEAGLRAARTAEYLPEKEVAALRTFRATGNAALAARTAHISPERFRRFLRSEEVAERRGRKWLTTDTLVRETDMITRGEWRRVRVRGFDPASAIALHRAAVRRFLVTRDPVVLAPFEGQSVTDVAGRQHSFETRPNALLRLMTTGGETYESVYRIVV